MGHLLHTLTDNPLSADLLLCSFCKQSSCTQAFTACATKTVISTAQPGEIILHVTPDYLALLARRACCSQNHYVGTSRRTGLIRFAPMRFVSALCTNVDGMICVPYQTKGIWRPYIAWDGTRLVVVWALFPTTSRFNTYTCGSIFNMHLTSNYRY